MNTWIALLRGINVGGKNRLPMDTLRNLLAQQGCEHIRTYIQSGNAVFSAAESDAEKLSGRISLAIAQQQGFQPPVICLRTADLEQAVRNNPFTRAGQAPPSLHVYFLAARPAASAAAALDRLAAGNERWAWGEGVMYLHAPHGVGRSKLAGGAEAALGVDATARNWKTVNKLLEMAKS